MIKFEKVRFGYHEVDVINNISFNIPKNKYTCIVGHNGSGKSTIAKLIMGLESCRSGKIFVDGIEVNTTNLDIIREKIGIVFQNPDNQFIATTVEDDIAFTLENACVPQHQMQNIIEEYATKVGMKQYLKHDPEKLSGGQKQRVALASVLVGSSEAIIFDEATSMLDPEGKQEINQLITELKHDRTIISITHDMEELLNADYVIVLEKGNIVLEGTPDKIFSDIATLQQLRLRLPFVLQVIQEAKLNGFNVNNTMQIEEVVEDLCQLV